MKLKNELIIICLILFILISISAVSAANNNTDIITLNNDDNDNILSINNTNDNEILTATNDGSFADLNTKINGGGSNIVLDRDYTYNSNDKIKGGIVIYKDNTVIDGKGHTIDAKGNSRIFNVTATTVTLKNIIFKNGFTDSSGGAIYGYGDNLRVYNCTFVNNHAYLGGAVYSYPNSYTAIVNSTFNSNSAKYGGAVYARNHLSEPEDDFIVNGNRHDIVNCTFVSNTATTQGGALAIYGQLNSEKHNGNDIVNIRGSSFTNNNAPEGDAIANIVSAYVSMSDSVVLGNQDNAVYSWGRMFFADNNWWGTTVDNKNNRPGITTNVIFDKWLYFDLIPDIGTSTATVSINNLYDSETGEDSIYSTSRLPSVNVKLNSVNATFNVNNVDLDHSGKAEVGFVLIGDCTLTANCEGVAVSKKFKIGSLSQLGALIENAADNSVFRLDRDYVYIPGVDLPKHRISVSDKHNLVIDGNGHAVNGMGKSVLFSFEKNSSDITVKNLKLVNGFSNDYVDGPAGYVLAPNTKFINCTFTNNTAIGIGTGGALYANAFNTSIIDCKFITNHHKTSSGGAVYLRGEGATIINTLFENNTATAYNGRGGAVFLYDGGSIVKCTFIHNSADYAGATYNYNSGHTTIDDCTFRDNVALAETIQSDDGTINGAGAVYATDTAITNSRFINNTAVSGAAIILAASSSTVDRCTFINNTANSPNGIILGIHEGGSITNSIFLNNKLNSLSGYEISTIYGKLRADYNWFGKLAKDYSKAPMEVSNLADMNKWIFLNATYPEFNDDGRDVKVQFNFYVYDKNTKIVIYYDSDNLPEFNFTVSTQNLTLNKNQFAPDENIQGELTKHKQIGEEGEHYVYDYKGTITAQYENVKYVVPFSYQKETRFEANSTYEVMKEQTKYLDIKLHPFEDDYLIFLFSSGRITYSINDTSIVNFNSNSIKITGLKVGLATITFNFAGKDYMGLDKYTPSTITVLVNVTKAGTQISNSTTVPTIMNVGENGKSNYIIFELKNYANKKVSGTYELEFINNNPNVLEIVSTSFNSFFYRTIGEGKASVTVKFNGNNNYLPSSRDFTFLVGRKDPKLSVSPQKIDLKVSKTYYVSVSSLATDNITYISNDTGVAVMDDNCVYAIGEGVAKIAIKFPGNDKYLPATAYLIVNVTSVKTYIDINKTLDMLLTDSYYLDPALRDMDGKLIGRFFDYVSNDTSVVTVDEYGIVTAVGKGVAKLTITSPGRDQYAPAKADVTVTVTVGVSEISVNSNVEIPYKKSTNLNATLNHPGTLTYQSSNPDVVGVDKFGKITAKKMGDATITISYEGSAKYEPCTTKVKVKVVKAPTEIDVGKSFAWIIGNTDTINATLNPNIGGLTFKSNDESIIKVDNNGKISALDVGKTTVSISFAGNENYLPSSKTVDVAVYASEIPTAIEVNKTFDLYVDDVINMNAIINPSNAGKLTYVSSNPNIVSVDGNGKITAKKVGQAKITISYAGNNVFLSNSTDVLVTVSLIPTSIEAKDIIAVNLTESAKLDYTFSNPKAGQLIFLIDDLNIAGIKNGIVTGEKVGETTITIKFEGNAKYAPSNATVKVIVTDVTTLIEAPNSIEVNVTETSDIIAKLNPKQAGKLIFVSNDKDIISVDGNGRVYGISLGVATVDIILEANGKYRSTNKTVVVVVKDVEPVIDVADSLKVNVTETASIKASVSPEDAGKLVFTTNSDIISVDSKGNVKGLKIGTSTVTLSLSANGKYRAVSKNVTVTVTAADTQIEVDDDDIIMAYGDETTIEAALKPNAGGKLIFTSNNPGIVTVDENGNVKAVKPGLATVTVSYEGEGKYKSSAKNVTVTVTRAPTSISIDESINMEIGLGYRLNPTVSPKKLDLTYASANSDIVEVDNSGFVFSNRYGSTQITISFAGDEYYLPSNATVTISVNPRETRIQVNDTVTIGFDESRDLAARLYATLSNFTVDGKLKYVTSDPNIVTVDATGLITANAIGNATIYISFDGTNVYTPSNATVNVEVTTRTTNIKVNETSLNLYVDDTYSIGAVLEKGPDGARLNYMSDNMNIVRVNPLTGEISAIGEGSATITVLYPGDEEYHSSSAKVSVSVSRYKTQIKAKTSYEMEVYEDLDLNAVVMPNEGVLTYISSDEDVVTVDSNGKLTAKKSGNAVITIKFEGDRKYRPSQKDVIVDVSRIATSINITNLILGTGVEYDLGKVVLPEGVPTRARYYEYASWDTEIFDVDNGVISTYQKGSAQLYVGFLGNDVYLPSNATVTVTVVKNVLSPDDYNFTVEVDDDAGQATFNITLPEDAEGNFIVTLNGEDYGIDVVGGKGSVVIDELVPKDYKATLKYSGDLKYEGVSKKVKFRVGRYKIDKNKDVDVLLGSYAKYTVHLTKDTQAMENKTIKFKVNGKTYYAVTNRNGYASIKVKLPAMKKYTVTAQYGSIKVKNKIKVHVINAKDQKVSKRSDYLKFKVSLKKVNKKYLSKKKLTLKFNGKTYTAKTNSKGVASFTLKKKVFAKLKAGKSYKYTVKYSTDSVTKTIKIFK